MKTSGLIVLMLLLAGCATPSVKTAQDADIHVALGLNDLTGGDAAAAKAELLKAEALAPHSAHVQVALGYDAWQVGEMEQADKFYQKAVALAPNDPDVLNDYGVFLCETGREKMAIPYFLKAAVQPAFTQVAKAYYNAGLCAQQINDPNASVYFTRAKQEDPNIMRPYYTISLSILD